MGNGRPRPDRREQTGTTLAVRSAEPDGDVIDVEFVERPLGVDRSGGGGVHHPPLEVVDVEPLGYWDDVVGLFLRGVSDGLSGKFQRAFRNLEDNDE